MNFAKLQNEPIGQLIRRKLQYSIFRQRWNIGLMRHPAPVVAGLHGSKRQRHALEDLVWMEERRTGFAADPFIARAPGTQDNYLVFFEYYPWHEQRGRIDCVKFIGGSFRSPTVALKSPYHLSYPYVFEYSGDCFVMPEHSQSGHLSLYRFDNDGVMNKHQNISAGPRLIDGSIIHLNDRYWMFSTIAGPNENIELNIHYAACVAGPWTGHAQNPVKSDKSNARPAGQIIAHAGKLFRPAQDCGSHYGAGIVVNELKTLTEDEFEEAPVSEIRPLPCSRYEYGLHTISSAGDYTVIDGARLESAIHPSLDGLARYVLPRSTR